MTTIYLNVKRFWIKSSLKVEKQLKRLQLTNLVSFNIRLWVFKIFLKEDEKYLICRAIDTRISTLEGVSMEKWANKDDINKDIDDLNAVRNIFSTKLWR